MSYYCDVSQGHEYHAPYHDKEYGFLLETDEELFERFILEINQAGLSWLTILRKRESFLKAYHRFDIAKVAKYGEKDKARLLADAGIIRNRLKVEAAIENAKRIQKLQKEFGSFGEWIAHHHPLTRSEWTKLFKQTFVFTGGEIVNEFLMSTGYLPGAHKEDCFVYKKLLKQKVPWMKAQKAGFTY